MMTEKSSQSELYNDPKEFGKLLRELRKNMGITQKELGKQIGLKSVTVSAYERGRFIPPADKLYVLSKFFNVNFDMFSSTIIKEPDEVIPNGEIPELEQARRQVAKMDEMLYYYKNLTTSEQNAVINLTKRLS